MAGADDEVDPSITAVDSERGEGGADVSRPASPVSRPASPTPPPASQSRSPRRASQTEGNLSDVLAGMAARGELMPGLDDEDALLQGDEGREGDLNTVAGAAGRNR